MGDGFINILHITWFTAFKLFSKELGIKGRKNFFSKCSRAWCAGLTGDREQSFVFEMDDREKKEKKKEQGLANLSAAKRNKACGDWQIYVSG